MKKTNNKQIFLKKRHTLTLLLLIVTFFSATLSNSYANNISGNAITMSEMEQKKVTINMKGKSLNEILSEINKQTDISFVIDDDAIELANDKYSITARGKSVKECLDIMLKDKVLKYSLIGNSVVIEKQDKIVAPQDENIKGAIITVSGKIVDAKNGKPLVGATVLVVDSKTGRGSITDAEGRFSVNVEAGAELEVSFTGYKNQKYKTNIKDANNSVTIKLEADNLEVEDVIVTGYGNIRRESYTGNVVTIKKDELLRVSKTNIINALQTFDPSFRVLKNNLFGSDPNAMPDINLRGATSLAQQVVVNADGSLSRMDLSKAGLSDNPNMPTFIMDGFEVSAQYVYDFDPNRIQEINILKDAAATAIYGSRAANGVVVITTVTPKPGDLYISYNTTVSLTTPDLSSYNMANAAQKLDIEQKAGFYDDPMSPMHAAGYIDEYNKKLLNVMKGVDTDWMAFPVRSAINHQHTLSIEGGSETFRYGANVSYGTNAGAMKGSYRNTVGADIFFQYIYKNFSIKNQVQLSVTDSEDSPYGSFSEYVRELPYETPYNDDGSIKQYLTVWDTFNESNSFDDEKSLGKPNPIYEATLGSYSRSASESYTNNLSLNWQINDDLLFKTQFSIRKGYSNSNMYTDPRSLRNTMPLTSTNLVSGELSTYMSNDFSYNLNATLSYNKQLNGHNINALVGWEISDESGDATSNQYRGFPIGGLSSPSYAQYQVGTTGYSDNIQRRVGVISRLNYTYKDIYLLDASLRIDGSSQFGYNQRTAPFWSVGAGINIHKYKFLEDSKVISEFRIRGSYGETGEIKFSPYDSFLTYGVKENWYRTGIGAVLYTYGNPDLTWQTTITTDLGFEVNFFDDMLYLKGSYYNKLTDDLISDVNLKPSTGFNSYKDNIGKTLNRGFEIELKVRAYRNRDLSIYLNANLAHNRNTIKELSDSMKEYNEMVKNMYEKYTENQEAIHPVLQFEEGGSLSAIYGVPSLGINPVDGYEIYVKRDGTFDDEWDANDQIVVGNTEPTAQGSFGFNITYKNFSLFSSFMYTFGGDVYNSTMVEKIESVNAYADNVDLRVLTDRWLEEGDISKFMKINSSRSGPRMSRPTSRFVQQENKIAGTSIELSYELPQHILNKWKLGRTNLSLGTNDMFYLSTIKQERGTSYPFARTYNFTLRTAF